MFTNMFTSPMHCSPLFNCHHKVMRWTWWESDWALENILDENDKQVSDKDKSNTHLGNVTTLTKQRFVLHN